jgi:hypothetical protein
MATRLRREAMAPGGSKMGLFMVRSLPFGGGYFDNRLAVLPILDFAKV